MTTRLFLAASAALLFTGKPAVHAASARASTDDSIASVAVIATTPPEAAYAHDPGDSLYRAARDALNAGDYVRAAQMFERIAAELPQSSYAPDALYWEAFALYRTSDTDQLRRAKAVLDDQATRYPKASTIRDAATLRTRIDGQLARRGDPGSAARIDTAASQPCANVDDEMRAAALSALQQMNPAEALPILQKVLTRRDECSASLRRKAVFILSQVGGDKSADLLLDVVRTDPDQDVRREAVWWLSQVNDPRAAHMLDSIIQHSTDESLRMRALDALANSDTPGSHTTIQHLISDPSQSEDLRGHAMSSLGHMSGTPEDAAFLEKLYPTLQSEALKQKAIEAIASAGNEAAGPWLIGVTEDATQSLGERKMALFWSSQARTPIATLTALYDRLKEPEIKKQMIFVLSDRDEKEAIDKLLEIARHDPDREMRKQAIFWLGQKDDPRVRELLLEIISQ